ncbi:MAG: Gfo/Idh/MocA family oxidoreductase [Actinomycetota bacterium]
MTSPVLRFGTLGAARITPPALLEPAAERDDVTVGVVAARDPARARSFAAEHGIPNVVDDYAAVVGHPDVDAVYVALPASEHREWTIAALEAGKHVLCEKPFANNAAEAAEMARAGADTDLVLCEAFHWRYHPLADRLIEVVRSGELGTIRRATATFTVPITDRSDIRHRLELGGGALMDLGCYPVQWVRAIADGEPEVLSATAETGEPDVDVRLDAELRFPDGVDATIVTGMEEVDTHIELVVEGDAGRMVVQNPLAPQAGHELVVEIDGARRSETVAHTTSYAHQLDAFVAAVRGGPPVVTDAADAVRNMQVIDDVYRAAGLPVRGADRLT